MAFRSSSSNLVEGDTNGAEDVFVYDRRTRTVERVSVSSSGAEAKGASFHIEPPWLSHRGRMVTFSSDAANLVPEDTNQARDVFVHDRRTGSTSRVSVGASGAQGDGPSLEPRLSADGRVVVFQSESSNLGRSDSNQASDVFVHDRRTGRTRRVSVSSSGAEGNGGSSDPAVSDDGRFVSFTSDASNLVRGDTNRASDVFVHDRRTARTQRVSVSSSEAQGNAASLQSHLSARGGLVAFTSEASTLVRGDTNQANDIFVRNRLTGTTSRISIAYTGAQANGHSRRAAGFSGRHFVIFASDASNLVPGDTNAVRDAFVHDRRTGRTERVSVSSAGAQANGPSGGARLSADGRFAAFHSFASNLVPGDASNTADAFVRGPLRPGLFKVQVRPRRARSGERTCFRFGVRKTVTGGPVGRARVRLGGQTRRTNTRGRARICRTFRSSGVRSARVTKRGFRTKRVDIPVL